MLVLTRRVGEEIAIGENVRLRVVAVQGRRIRLGVAAPKSVHVRREEVSATERDPAGVTAPELPSLRVQRSP